MNQNEIDASGQGPIYLTIGTGGDSHSKGPINDLPEPWVAHRDNTEYGFGELFVANATHAYLERKLNRGTKANPLAQDAVWILNHNTAKRQVGQDQSIQ